VVELPVAELMHTRTSSPIWRIARYTSAGASVSIQRRSRVCPAPVSCCAAATAVAVAGNDTRAT